MCPGAVLECLRVAFDVYEDRIFSLMCLILELYMGNLATKKWFSARNKTGLNF